MVHFCCGLRLISRYLWLLLNMECGWLNHETKAFIKSHLHTIQINYLKVVKSQMVLPYRPIFHRHFFLLKTKKLMNTNFLSYFSKMGGKKLKLPSKILPPLRFHKVSLQILFLWKFRSANSWRLVKRKWEVKVVKSTVMRKTAKAFNISGWLFSSLIAKSKVPIHTYYLPH